MKVQCTGLLSALASFVLLISSCGPAPGGSAFVEVRALAATDIARVEVTVSGSGIPTDIVQTLAGDPIAGWSGTILDIPPGADRTFTGRAYDAADVLIYQGSASPVTIVGDETALVTIFMQQVNPPPPWNNATPRITGLTVSSYTVSPGGTISLAVTAVDPDPGDTLTYAWSAPSGSFSNPSAASTDWTAPAALGSVVIHLGVSDDSGATATLDIGISVASGVGAAFVLVDVNTAPEIISIVPSPTQLDIGDNTYLDLTVVDPDGDSLTFEWDDEFPCTGTFDNTAVEDATFYLSGVQNPGDDCAVSVRVGDGRGAFSNATVSLATGPGVCGGTICGPPTVSPGSMLWINGLARVGFTEGGDVTYDPDQDLVVNVSSWQQPGGWRIVADIYTPSGVYVDSFVPSNFTDEKVYAVTTGDDGVGYAVGWVNNAGTGIAYVQRFDNGWSATGWSHGLPGLGAYDVEVGPNGDPYVVGIAGVSTDTVWVGRIDAPEGPIGNVWSEFVSLGTIHEGGGLDFTTADEVVVCASYLNGADYDLWLGKYTLGLAPIWTRTWTGGPAGRDERCEDLDVDGLGNIFVVGSVEGAGDSDWWVAKFDSSGAFINEVIFDEGGDEVARSLVIPGNGTVYVAGDGDSGLPHPILRAYRNTLLDFWSTSPSGISATGIELHPSGDLLMTGTLLSADVDPWVGRFAP